MKIKGKVKRFPKTNEPISSAIGEEAEIELSAEDLAKQLTISDMAELGVMHKALFYEKNPEFKPTEPERCEHEWADLLYSSGGACGCWNTFRCIKCGELKSVENKPEPPKRIEELSEVNPVTPFEFTKKLNELIRAWNER